MIKIVASTDVQGFAHNATVLASVLRRTKSSVWARIYTRGFSYPDFETGRLRAEFIRCDEEVSGKYPPHVTSAVFDRLRIIRDSSDWDRALVLDHDMLVFTDLASYFEEPFDGNLLMGRLFGPGNTIGLQMKKRGGLPEEWKHCESYPYFHMGPMMNLEAMRAEGFWEHLLEVHAAVGHDEQISLTAASGGRVKDVDKKWNLVPTWDKLADACQLALDSDADHAVVSGVTWRRGIPEGLVHWTGGAKPWHHQSKVWRADLWESELCGWEQLRAGTWRKPVSLEIHPGDIRRACSLLKRGWKVQLHSDFSDFPGHHPATGSFGEPYPDLVHPAPAEIAEVMAQADMVRFGPDTDPLPWLERASSLPDRIVLEGPRDAR